MDLLSCIVCDLWIRFFGVAWVDGPLADSDDALVQAVADAIADSRIGVDIQGIHTVHHPSAVLYGECLARLVDPQGRRHEASEFIPALERRGATPMLDGCMIRLVLNQLEADPLAVLGCNLSADTLVGQKAWLSVIEQVGARAHLARRLVLEITETRPLGEIGCLSRRLDQARRLGCRIAIDDFGTGHLTPLQLYQLSTDIVKLDAGFIWEIRGLDEKVSSLRHLVDFAKSFVPVVVIEGVESAADFRNARAAGASHVQGWYLSRPTPAGLGKKKPAGT